MYLAVYQQRVCQPAQPQPPRNRQLPARPASRTIVAAGRHPRVIHFDRSVIVRDVTSDSRMAIAFPFILMDESTLSTCQ